MPSGSLDSLRRLALQLALVCLGLSLSATAAPLPEGAVLADLPMLSIDGSPYLHFDLAAPGDPPLPVLLDTGVGASFAGKQVLETFERVQQPDGTVSYSRDTVLGRPLLVQPGEPSTSEQAERVRLGGETLRGYVVELDFEARRVRFLDPDKVELPEQPEAADETSLPLQVFVNRPFAVVDLNDHPIRVGVDTSAPVPLWVSPRDLVLAAISPRTLPVLRPKSPPDSALRLFETDQIRLGSLDPGVFPVLVSKRGFRDALGHNGPVLGLDLLSQFKVRIDLDRKRLWLKQASLGPVSFAGIPYALTRKSGAFLTRFGDHFEVDGVLPDSPAQQLGLQPGDTIEIEQSGLSKRSQQLNAIRKLAPLLVSRPVDTTGETVEVLLPQTPADAD